MPGTALLGNPEYEVPWTFVREKWSEYWEEKKSVLLEKSPSNVHRAFEIQKHFQPASFLALIRDPYAFCEGCTHRKAHYSHWDSAHLWVRCAESQRHNVVELDHVMLVRYEDLTEEIDDVLRQIVEFLPRLQTFRPKEAGSTFTVMGEESRIHNVNPAKVQRLTPGGIQKINEVLSEQADLLEFFDYRMRTPSEHSRIQAWRTRAATASVRGLRWMRRKGILSSAVADRVETVLT